MATFILIFVIDFNGFFGVYTNFQFHTVTAVLALFPIFISVIIVSTSFALVISQIKVLPSIFRYLIVSISAALTFTLVGLFISVVVELCQYNFSSVVLKPSRDVACAIYSLTWFLFVLRGVSILYSLKMNTSLRSDKEEMKRKQNNELALWISLMFLANTMILAVSIESSVNLSHTNDSGYIVEYAVLFFGGMLHGFSSNMVYKPRKKSSTTFHTEKVSKSSKSFKSFEKEPERIEDNF